MLSRRSLRAMKARWLIDLDRLEKAYYAAKDLGEESNSESETLRNLATAIAEIDGLIAIVRPGDRTTPNTKGNAND